MADHTKELRLVSLTAAASLGSLYAADNYFSLHFSCSAAY